MRSNRKGQSTLEYGLLIAVVIVALLAVNVYLKRGVQGRLRESTDQIGRQFDPEKFQISYQTTTSNGMTNTTETRQTGGNIVTNIAQAETLTRSELERFGKNAIYTGNTYY